MHLPRPLRRVGHWTRIPSLGVTFPHSLATQAVPVDEVLLAVTADGLTDALIIIR